MINDRKEMKMVTNKTFRKLQERYEASAKALFGAAREVAELKRKLDAERSAREALEKRVKELTRTIADVEEILHDA